MLDDGAWLRLISGLADATENGDLEWSLKSTRSGEGFSAIMRMYTDSLNPRVIYSAHSRSGFYELSAGDALGHAPYELAAWDITGQKQKPLGSIRSSVEVATSYGLNQALDRLFAIVAANTESGDEIVNRLLGDFEDHSADH
ncbi:hypothetical protein [Agromyces sp. NPDC055658]